MRVALTLAVLVAVVAAASPVLDGCDDCPPCCTTGASATFLLSCGTPNLTSVVATGPCATPDASASHYKAAPAGAYESILSVESATPGDCHIELTFATGFTYSADVTFTQHGGPECKWSYVGPTSGPFTVNNPSDTCVDARPDGGADE
jgi:hypothetical protein